MPQPTQSQVHVDAALTSISIAYMQSQDVFIADKVFPTVPVDKQTDKYFTYTKDDWFRDEMQRRADGTESAGGGFRMSPDSYSCDVWAYHKDIGPQLRANADAAINVDGDATRFVTTKGLIRRERQWASDYFTTGVWANDKVGGTDFTQWDDQAGSDPIDDIKQGRVTMLQNTGYLPNVLVLGYEVFEALKEHPLITDKFKYTSSDSISEAMLARVFDVQRVVVAKSVYATNKEGGAASMAFVHGKHALLAYAAPSPGLLLPSAGYIFVWRGLTGLNALGQTISSFFLPQIKADRVEIEMAFDCKKVASDLGYFFSGAVS